MIFRPEDKEKIKSFLLEDFYKNLIISDREKYFEYIKNVKIILEYDNDFELGASLFIKEKEYAYRIKYPKIHIEKSYLLGTSVWDYILMINKKIAHAISITLNQVLPDIIKEEYADKLDKQLTNKETIKKVKI